MRLIDMIELRVDVFEHSISLDWPCDLALAEDGIGLELNFVDGLYLTLV